jgi:FKBP-type peptidyl-prolyl cis-trans isomerase
MTQTMNGQNKDEKQTQLKRPAPTPPQPMGQRQQERQMRKERRRKRRNMMLASAAAIFLVIVGVFGIVRYQQYQSDTQAAADKVKNDHATATANTQATSDVRHATATAQVTATANAQLLATALSGSPVPTAGPASPPAVTGTVVKLKDGLQYIVVKAGSGPEAKQGATVLVQYTGWLKANGKKFDSSYDHGAQPFPLANLGPQAQVIPGWQEGLIGVKPGETRRLIIPAALGYGAQAQGTAIPANSDLIFDVTILSVTNP